MLYCAAHMELFVPKETNPAERRIALVPAVVRKLSNIGARIVVESGLGNSISISDASFREAGAELSNNRRASLGSANIVLRVHQPPQDEIAALQPGCVHISFLDAFNEREIVRALAEAKVTAISINMLPRVTIAQPMDALSSQASLAGYVAVITAAANIDRIFPMMMTPAGTIAPLRVFVIGVGVAGLQAIATAKRLGARVDAFDTRPIVEEQVQSLGAKFVKIDLGQTGQTAEGYAKELTPEQLNKQREVMARHCAQADVVITTAQIFGKKAPLIVTTEMIEQMRPGSVIVDMAVESGGNVESSKLDEIVDVNGVRVIGFSNLPARVALDASEMYANNLSNLVQHCWDKEAKEFRLDLNDVLLKECVITHDGKIVNAKIENLYRS